MDFLDVHPQIKAAKNEAHFFNKRAYKFGLDYYRKKMPESNLGEFVSHYFNVTTKVYSISNNF